MPSMVRDVSAMLVETMHFLPLRPFLLADGGASNIFYCIAGVNVLYKGITLSGGASSPSLSTSFLICLQAVSISSSPVRNSKMSPGSSKQCIYTAVLTLASR